MTATAPDEKSVPERTTFVGPGSHVQILESLRGLAVLQVVLHHASGHVTNYTGLSLTLPFLGIDGRLLFSFGGFGVPVFFILSGYLLTWTEENRASRSPGAYSFRSYALRRIFRLVPAFYLAVVAYAIFKPGLPEIGKILAHIPFLHAIVPNTSNTLNAAFWTLSAEAVFYLLLPFIVLKLPRLWHRLALLGTLLGVSVISRFYVIELRGSDAPGSGDLAYYVNFLPSSVLYLFLFGVLLQMLVKNLGDRRLPAWQPWVANGLFVLSALSLLIMRPTGLKPPGINTVIPATTFKELLVVAMFTSLVLGSTIFIRILRWRFLAFLGLISYSLYLFHNLVILLGKQHVLATFQPGYGPLASWGVFLAYMAIILAAACGVSYLSYRYVESPFMRYKPK